MAQKVRPDWAAWRHHWTTLDQQLTFRSVRCRSFLFRRRSEKMVRAANFYILKHKILPFETFKWVINYLCSISHCLSLLNKIPFFSRRRVRVRSASAGTRRTRCAGGAAASASTSRRRPAPPVGTRAPEPASTAGPRRPGGGRPPAPAACATWRSSCANSGTASAKAPWLCPTRRRNRSGRRLFRVREKGVWRRWRRFQAAARLLPAVAHQL